MVQRDDDSGTAQWIYDSAPHGIGKLAAMVSPSDTRLADTCQIEFAPDAAAGEKHAGRSYHYTPFGDVDQVTDCADGSTFLTNYGYDGFGRPNLLRYPVVKGNRFAVKYAYSKAGYLHYVTDDATGKVMWAATAMNAAGQVTDEVLGNGVETESLRNDATGWLLGRTSTSHVDGESVIQGWGYAFDEAGNLLARQRTDGAGALAASETFGVDSLDRLVSSEVKVPAQGYSPESYTYDAFGNLQTKAGKSYKYGTGCLAGGRAAGPHAVCQIDDGPTYNYDGNGNLLSVGDRTVDWNAANKATRLTDGTGDAAKTADFIYGADGQRVVQAVGTGAGALGSSSNTMLSRTVYVGLGATGKSVYERTTHGSTIEHSHFIYAGAAHGGNAFAIQVVTEDTSSSSTPMTTPRTEYHHFDHLGSVVAVTDGNGHVTSAVWSGPSGSVIGYDPWGAIRSPSGHTADPATYASPAGNRGFTDQEAIPSLGLVNMNGRIYDPMVGRFLSPDPNVQFASDLQSYNRYSYAADNPLRYTDPTGYYHSRQPNFFQEYSVEIQFAETVGTVVLSLYGGPYGYLIAAGINTTINTTAAIESGTAWNQALAMSVVNFGISYAAGALGAGIAGATIGEAYGSAAGVQLLGSAIGGGLMGAYSTVASGGSLGENILTGAAQGVYNAAVMMALGGTNPVSQASAEEQGGGPLAAQRGKLSYQPWVTDDAYNHDPDVIADRQAQIDQNVKAHGYYFLEGNLPQYDPDLRVEGQTVGDGTVTIGPKAFNSDAWLTATVEHESVHVEQIRDGTFLADRVILNEVQAYDREIASAKANGITQDELAQTLQWRQAYYDQLTTRQKVNVWLGSY
jgi:RHS repeat-associated protein